MKARRPHDARWHAMPMEEAISFAREIGAAVSSKGSELVFKHRLMPLQIIANGNRKDATKRLLSWLRRLYTMRVKLNENVDGLAAIARRKAAR